MRGIHAHVRHADIAVSRYIDLQRSAGVKGHIGANAKDSMEVRRIGWSDADRNHHWAIDLTTGKFEPGCQRDRCHPGHTSETHRYPEEEVVVRIIATEAIIVTIARRPR